MEVNEFIESIKDTFGRYPSSSCGCLKFHLILRQAFPDAGDLWYNSDHVITPIGGKFYEIDGERKDTEGFLPFSEFGTEYFLSAFELKEPFTSLFNRYYEKI